MKVSKEEILHIAKLADLEIKEEEIEKYALNLQDILNFANTVNNAPVDGLDVTIGANEKKNVYISCPDANPAPINAPIITSAIFIQFFMFLTHFYAQY